MKLNEAKKNLDLIIQKPLGEWMTQEQLFGIIINKGKTGQLLEIALGLRNTSTNLDFSDGELKTNKCDRKGVPKETMFITQISTMMDDLLASRNFYDTRLYSKIDNYFTYQLAKMDHLKNGFFFLTHILIYRIIYFIL